MIQYLKTQILIVNMELSIIPCQNHGWRVKRDLGVKTDMDQKSMTFNDNFLLNLTMTKMNADSKTSGKLVMIIENNGNC